MQVATWSFTFMIFYAFIFPLSSHAENATDQLHEDLSQRVTNLANRIDNFFGERRALDAKNKSTLVLSATQDFPEGGIPSPQFGAALNLKLLNLEKLGRKLEDDLLGIKTGPNGQILNNSEKAPQPERPVYPWRLVLDQQVGAKWPPTYSAKLRLSKEFLTGPFLQHFEQEYGWDTDNLWNSKTALSSDYSLSSSWLFRWINQVNWYFSRIFITSTHGPSFIHTIDDFTSMSYNLRLETEYVDNRLLYTSGYLASITYRRDLYKKWLYLNLIPSISFPRNKSFTRVLNFGIGFELIIGDT